MYITAHKAISSSMEILGWKSFGWMVFRWIMLSVIEEAGLSAAVEFIK
jgi:hypothetical protein